MTSIIRLMAGSVVVAAILLCGSTLSAQDCASGATFSGPITITSGGTYTGNWQSTDPSIPAVTIRATQPVTIVNSRLRGSGDLLISGPRSNVTVRESCFVGTYPTAAGTGKGHAMHLFQAANVIIEHNDFESTGGYNQGTVTAGAAVWVQQYMGDGTLNNTIKIRYNRFHNLDGRISDGRGGYLTAQTSQWSTGIHPSDINGVPGIEIAWNQIINDPYRSGGGDSINIFDTSGTSASPVQVHDNYIQGGWDSDPANGDGLSYFGSAITTDGFFQTDPRWTIGFVKIHDNQAVGFGNAGIVIALGHDVEMYNNRAISSGQLADGTSSGTSYAKGIMHINWRDNPPSAFFNNSVHDNVSGARKRRNGSWEREDYYFGVPATVNSNNAQFSPPTASTPTPADEANEFVLWTRKLNAQDVTVGVSPHAILPGRSLRSPSGRFRLTYQTDGNLVLYDDSSHNGVWTTNTGGTSAGQAIMQLDGNFVVYDAGGIGRWSSGTSGNPNAYLSVQDDGNLVIFRADGQPVWDRIQGSIHH